MNATAIAHPNIALVKYWGKRDAALNLPATGSYSLTLAPIRTRTTVSWGQAEDRLVLNGAEAVGRPLTRIQRFLDLLRADHPSLGHAHVESDNDFPTAAGLASSSSGFAALALAATSAAGLSLSPAALSVLARQGSGSAARSLSGGFVEMQPGASPDGRDAFAVQRYAETHWDLRVLFALTTEGEKSIPSTVGMDQTVATSPYFQAWCDGVPAALRDVDAAVGAQDFERLASLAEASALQMHASAIAAVPGVLYWNGVTVELIHAVRELRAQGLPVFFTIDAGPHVKVFVEGHAAAAASAALREIPGVRGVFEARPGGDARIITDEPR